MNIKEELWWKKKKDMARLKKVSAICCNKYKNNAHMLVLK